MSLSIFLRFSVNDTVYYHILQTVMNYVRCPMNINSLKLQDISSTHIKVWNSDGVWFPPERKGCDLSELYLESQVSEGRPYSKGMCQFDKGWASPWMWKGWCLAYGQVVFQSSPLDINLPLCVPNNSNPERAVGIRMQKQKLHCWFQAVLSWESTHLWWHPTVDKVRISWGKARGQRRVVNYLGQWKMSFLENLQKSIAPEFAWKLYYVHISLLKIKHFWLSSIITAYRRVIEVIQFSSHWKWPTAHTHIDTHRKICPAILLRLK